MRTSHVVVGALGVALWALMMALTWFWSTPLTSVTKIPLPSFVAGSPKVQEKAAEKASEKATETENAATSVTGAPASAPANAPAESAPTVPATGTEAAAPAPAASDTWN
jgi:hypothetical protein